MCYGKMSPQNDFHNYRPITGCGRSLFVFNFGHFDHFQAWSPRVSKVQGGPQGWLRWYNLTSLPGQRLVSKTKWIPQQKCFWMRPMTPMSFSESERSLEMIKRKNERLQLEVIDDYSLWASKPNEVAQHWGEIYHWLGIFEPQLCPRAILMMTKGME